MININKYERLENISNDIKINKINMPKGIHGVLIDRDIYIDKQLPYHESIEVLAEEIGHFYTSTGDITDYKNINNMKQEVKARRYSYELLVTLDDIINAWHERCRSIYDISECLDVSVKVIRNAIEHYKMKYGLSTIYGDYLIRFEPLNVYKFKKI